MYDPSNPNYGKYMTPEQFRAELCSDARLRSNKVQAYLAVKWGAGHEP